MICLNTGIALVGLALLGVGQIDDTLTPPKVLIALGMINLASGSFFATHWYRKK
jgi:hypothetical protein